MKHPSTFKHLRLLLLIVFSLALSYFDALAYDFEVDGIYYNKNSNKATVTYGGTYSGDVTIPETVSYDGTTYSVTSIGDNAFNGCYTLSSVTIPNSITSIGQSAFGSCFSLTSVTIGNSVSSIGSHAFEQCSKLSSITLPTSVKSLGEYAFRFCGKLTSITIPTSVTSIGHSPFYGCSALASFSGKYASSDNRCLIVNGVLKAYAPAGMTQYTIPSSVTSIGSEAFGACGVLSTVIMGNSVTSISNRAFWNCTDLTNVTIGNSVTSIGEESFAGCDKLKTFNGKYASEDHRCLIVNGVLTAFAPAGITQYSIPSTVTSIGYEAFYTCSKLTSVIIPNSVTSIGKYAFSGCSSLTSVTIPNSVTSIGNYAFYLCDRLSSITVENPTPTKITLGSSVFSNVRTNTCILYVPKSSMNLYKNANTWKDFTNIQAITFILTDANLYDKTIDYDDIDITYNRNFTNNTVWQCLYIPFDMSYEEWDGKARVAKFNNIHEYDEDDNGTVDKIVFEYLTVTEGKILPNKPYLIKPNAVGNVTFECEGKHLAAAPEEEGFVRCSSTKTNYILYGTYTGFEKGELYNKGAYVIGSNGFGPASQNAALSPQRFYLVLSDNENGYGSEGNYEGTVPSRFPERIEIMIDGDTVGIADVIVEREDGAYYDLQGRRIANPERGIFIHNGKKVIIK